MERRLYNATIAHEADGTQTYPSGAEEPAYMLHRSDLAADDAEHFTGEYAVFHPIKGAYSFDTEEEAVAFMTEE